MANLSHTHKHTRTDVVDIAKLSPAALTAGNTEEGEMDGARGGGRGGKREGGQKQNEAGRRDERM